MQRIIQSALKRADEADLNLFSSAGEAQVVLDEIWKVRPLRAVPFIAGPHRYFQVLDSPALPDSGEGGSQFQSYKNKLRKLTLKMAVSHSILPSTLVLRGVELVDGKQHGAGGFADVYWGNYRGYKVALKKLRVYIMATDTQKVNMRKVRIIDPPLSQIYLKFVFVRKSFLRESIIWKNLVHEHIVPFLGVSEDVFEGTLCMVLPWLDNGSLRHYIDSQRSSGRLDDAQFVVAVDKWVGIVCHPQFDLLSLFRGVYSCIKPLLA